MPRPEILPTHTPALFQRAVIRAVEVLQSGRTVALPSETVYGLAANAFSPEAVEGIYRAKGRPANNPLIVHVATATMARECASAWPPLAERLAGRFWPGPLTLVVPRSSTIPDLVCARGPTVGLRWPSHPLFQAVIRQCGFPLAAPSANPSDQLSPTTAEHVVAGLGDRVPLVVDAGPCAVGIESTVVDVTGPRPRILRPGVISSDQVAEAAGIPCIPAGDPGAGPLRSPGQLHRHYSPRARLVVCSWRDDRELSARLARESVPSEQIHLLAHSRIPDETVPAQVSFIPDDPEAFARALYGYLHQCDDRGARLIVVESPPPGAAWDGVRDRLLRASAPSDPHP
ncbi:MAG: Threonylcarbamoyl-AMP synthase [Verrucomicrobiota bacterium]|jgi:L-threonylcarbamoyladenylate synthase